LLALKRAEDGQGVVLRVQETAGQSTAATLSWHGRKISLGIVGAYRIASWRLNTGRACRISIIEK
ncbi:MAG: glycosyl hydrolase-related protein, partial [Verrucomicrobiota bacterium]